MRADRLLSILMLLQSRGRMTAGGLAQELEVSERTIYRDINALSYAGVPVYTERGPGGGIALIERYRSDLTGLTKDEVRALFMLNIPPALVDLGLDKELRAALLKLSAALPATMRADEQRVRERLHIDPSSWKPEIEASPTAYLQVLQQAVWESLELKINYHTFVPLGLEPIETILWPFGLVAKADNWHVVAKRRDHMVVLRVDRIQEIELTGRNFARPDDFNLVRFWEKWCQEFEQNRPIYPVSLRVSSLIWQKRNYFFGAGVRQVSEPDAEGWRIIETEFEYHEEARRKLLSFGGGIEVLEPVALRHSMIDYAEQIRKRYSG
jgi:predicted DNA-binding transcriptional regulator YafY